MITYVDVSCQKKCRYSAKMSQVCSFNVDSFKRVMLIKYEAHSLAGDVQFVCPFVY